MKVSDFMTKNVVSIEANKTVEDAARLMLEKNISVLPVVDSTSHLIGIITESDFIGKEANVPHAVGPVTRVLGQILYDGGVEEIYLKVKHYPIEKVMTRNPFTLRPNDNLSDVVSVMNSKKLKKIPVIEDNKLLGIVTRHDVVRAFTSLSGSQDSISAS